MGIFLSIIFNFYFYCFSFFFTLISAMLIGMMTLGLNFLERYISSRDRLAAFFKLIPKRRKRMKVIKQANEKVM